MESMCFASRCDARAHRTAVRGWLLWLVAASIALAPVYASAQNAPKQLRGKIITSDKPIDIPSAKGFEKKLRKQDRKKFRCDPEGKWVIYFVAFFNRPLPIEQMGVVVLDAKKEPVAVANVSGQKGQRTLASQIVVDTTESPGKPHVLQVFYAKGDKPIVLAKKTILLLK